jgi:hypothetical protein
MFVMQMIQMTMILAFSTVSFAILRVAIRRERRIRVGDGSAVNPIVRITMRRAIRCELSFSVIQLLFIAATADALFRLAIDPVRYSVYAQVTRTFASAVLAYTSVMDLRDRRKIADELDEMSRGKRRATDG